MISFSIRPAQASDMDAIAALYAHYVHTSPVTFELEAPDSAEMNRRRQNLADRGLPWLVAERSGGVAGYAYAGPHRSRPAYNWVLEDSIYIAPDQVGRGIGRALLDQLLNHCTTLGYRQMIAVIGDSANAASVALHRACGFSNAGVLTAVGWKFDRWIDTVLMQKALGPGGDEPVNP